MIASSDEAMMAESNACAFLNGAKLGCDELVHRDQVPKTVCVEHERNIVAEDKMVSGVPSTSNIDLHIYLPGVLNSMATPFPA